MTEAVRTEVFFIGGKTGWAVAPFDAEGNQIGEASYYFHRADAVYRARQDHPTLPCHVFKRDGTLGWIVQENSQTAP